MLFTSVDWLDQFSIQAVHFKDRFVHDAGAVYPSSLAAVEDFVQLHWSGDFSAGFKIPRENISQFHAALQGADILIDETYPHGQNLTLLVFAGVYGSPRLGSKNQ